MSILTGIYSKTDSQDLPEQLCLDLKNMISRNPADKILVFKNKRMFLAKTDLSVFGELGQLKESDDCFSMLAGDPLLSILDEQNREFELKAIHSQLKTPNYEYLENVQGVFSVAFFSQDKLSLVSDKLGLRPVYYWIGEKFVIFSTCLRILENLSFIPKVMDFRAVSETVALGYALDNRTPYKNVFLIRPGVVLTFDNQEVIEHSYWRWDKGSISTDNETLILQELSKKFKKAISQRLRKDTSTVAYLSGGLDSRCIVGVLSDFGTNVHTFNFARPDTQDQYLGRQFAEISKTHHTEIPKEAGDHVPDYSAKLANAWNKSEFRKQFPAERPSLIWSGEGGSVALGHVHLSQKIVDLMRNGQTEEAVKEYLSREHIYLSPKILNQDIAVSYKQSIISGILEEISKFNHQDKGKNFYLFLLLNDQRRKLAKHYENIDLHRLEFHLPFFDNEFLEFIVSIPLEICLRHQLYVKWLYQLPSIITSVPWQAYPGHEPCPLPLPEGLSYQWDNEYQDNEQKTLKKQLVQVAKEIIGDTDFPAQIIHKNKLRLAVLVYISGWKDYSYIIETAKIYHKYWKICQGNYKL